MDFPATNRFGARGSRYEILGGIDVLKSQSGPNVSARGRFIDRYRGVLTRTNILATLYVLSVWVGASAAIQFDTVSLLDPGFPGNEVKWLATGDSSNTVVDSEKIEIIPHNDKRASLRKSFDLNREDIGNRYILIEGKILSEKLSSTSSNESNDMEESIFYVWFGDENQDTIQITTVSELIHENRRFEASKVFKVPRGAYFINVSLLLRKFNSKHELISLEVRQMKKTGFYYGLLFLLVFIPAIALIRACKMTLTQRHFMPEALLLLVGSIVVIGVLLPGKAQTVFMRGFHQLLPGAEQFVRTWKFANVQDILHFLGFFMLAVIVLKIGKNLQFSIADIVVKLVIFAVFTEVIQAHSVERSPSLFDVILDLSGSAFGIIVWLFIDKSMTNRRESNEME